MNVLIYGYPVQGRVPQGDVLYADPNLVGMKVWDVTPDLFTAAHPREGRLHDGPEGAQPLTKLCGMSGGAVYVLKLLANSCWPGSCIRRAMRWTACWLPTPTTSTPTARSGRGGTVYGKRWQQSPRDR